MAASGFVCDAVPLVHVLVITIVILVTWVFADMEIWESILVIFCESVVELVILDVFLAVVVVVAVVVEVEKMIFLEVFLTYELVVT